MLQNIFKWIQNIAALFVVAMFFSCANSVQEVNDFFADKNLPVGESRDVRHVYKDSGRIVFRLNTPLLYDFSNREKHPYSEYPKGIKVVTISNSGEDSTTVTGDYAKSFNKTQISELIGNVVVYNHTEKSILKTPQLYWDQRTNYVFTEKKFSLITEGDTIRGKGFESNMDLTGWLLKKIKGDIQIKEEE
ncbi:LPS export ABC transporter periplasmic protein LptC [Flavicella sp.]|uniref:LPS export ABC transporter periplasmic protein LptC n=1 Tax=Flavicella sp. TaxID=2957742 RepID=UPI0026347532|nr:LPS export ABC transporter periplasmic protein LptC [Flavicella sp.]MDG1804467.1 LPS export ABC transporter periplasmic protein LptC [Flavicella sp.]